MRTGGWIIRRWWMVVSRRMGLFVVARFWRRRAWYPGMRLRPAVDGRADRAGLAARRGHRPRNRCHPAGLAPVRPDTKRHRGRPDQPVQSGRMAGARPARRPYSRDAGRQRGPDSQVRTAAARPWRHRVVLGGGCGYRRPPGAGRGGQRQPVARTRRPARPAPGCQRRAAISAGADTSSSLQSRATCLLLRHADGRRRRPRRPLERPRGVFVPKRSQPDGTARREQVPPPLRASWERSTGCLYSSPWSLTGSAVAGTVRTPPPGLGAGRSAPPPAAPPATGLHRRTRAGKPRRWRARRSQAARPPWACPSACPRRTWSPVAWRGNGCKQPRRGAILVGVADKGAPG